MIGGSIQVVPPSWTGRATKSRALQQEILNVPCSTTYLRNRVCVAYPCHVSTQSHSAAGGALRTHFARETIGTLLRICAVAHICVDSRRLVDARNSSPTDITGLRSASFLT